MLHLAGKYLVFVLQTERFAIPLNQVVEIIKPLPLTPVPHSSSFLQGIFNLRGLIVPLYDLRRLLFQQEENHQSMDISAVRYVLLKSGRLVLAVSCDRLEGIIPIDAAQCEGLPRQIRGISPSFLSGRVADKASEKDFLILNLEGILSFQQGGAEKSAPVLGMALAGGEEKKEVTRDKPLSIMTFLIGEKVFALELTEISELIELADTEQVASVLEYMDSVVDHRGRTIPLINLKPLLGMKEAETGQKSGTLGKTRKALVMDQEGECCAWLADELLEIREIAQSEIQMDATVLSSFGGDIRGVIEQNGDQRFILLINRAVLQSRIDFPLIEDHLGPRIREGTFVQPAEQVHEAREKYLVFSLLDLPLALPVNAVREIVTAGNLTPVPTHHSPHAGLTNVRGVVHSIIDLKAALGMRSVREEAAMIRDLAAVFFDEEDRDAGGASHGSPDNERFLSGKLGQLLRHRSQNKLFGSRACRLLHKDLSCGFGQKETMGKDFYAALEEEVEKTIHHPKILVLSHSRPLGLLVDAVSRVVEVGEKQLTPVAGEESEGASLPYIQAQLTLEETGFRALIPDLNALLGAANGNMIHG